MIRMKLTVDVPTIRDAVNLLDDLSSQDQPAEITVRSFSTREFVTFSFGGAA